MDKVMMMKMQIAIFQTNKYYSSHEEYVGALATQLETEYRKGDEIRSPNHCELELPKRNWTKMPQLPIWYPFCLSFRFI